MEFAKEGLEKLREKIEEEELKEIGKIKPEYFTRNRNLGFSRLIYYFLNKKAMSTG